MPLPGALKGRLKVPAIAAPMFLVSGPDLVVETARSGVLGAFPALNQRTTGGYADWLKEIEDRLSAAPEGSAQPAPFGVNLIVHSSNPRLEADLKITVDHKVPIVITSLGAVTDLVDAVHSYGNLVFHDVISTRHAEKAAAAGVGGIIAVSAGAGGHAGSMNPFALVSEIRRFFDKTIVLSGAISNGAQIAAAQLMGADLAYIGTRFIATRESLAPGAYKAMLIQAKAADIVYTPAISGVNANFMRQSIVAAGLDPNNLVNHARLDLGTEANVWREIWSAGQGVGSIDDIPTASELCARLRREFDKARSGV